ncbi:hypothetical protein SDC9_75678 [bioreactor metagenome]|uniref:Uncharacterized protein n=1 Tax=bioreactor metagenome TaxID=1076179 RepID=A0A644YLD4_9ZZZZ
MLNKYYQYNPVDLVNIVVELNLVNNLKLSVRYIKYL